MNKFPTILKQLRKEEKLTIVELSSKIEYSKSIISYWENGTKEPTLSALIKLSEYFCIPVDYLLGNESSYGANNLNLSLEEEKLIKDYRTLTPPLQRMVQETMRTFTDSELNSQSTKKKI